MGVYIGWLMDLLIGWLCLLFDWLGVLVGVLVCVYRLFSWYVGWLVGWLILYVGWLGMLVGWVCWSVRYVGWLGMLVSWVCWLVGWCVGWHHRTKISSWTPSALQISYVINSLQIKNNLIFQ